MELRGRTALVTGGGKRVGRAIALALGARGARVAVHYNRSAAGAEETAREIARTGGEARTFAADLSDAAAPESLVRQVAAAFGGLDLLVNSAAVMERTPVGTVTPAQWDAMFALNLRAPFFAAQAAAAAMGERGGAIVNIADLAAFETWPAYVPHSITKAGVVQMTRALARVLAPAVRVNAVAPGAVLLPDDWGPEAAERLARTTPLKRLGSPDDVASAVCYLAESDYITGETLMVDGGRHVR
ncbi:MAG TPA: SDR family oxidoreductase [Gemmatimonadaceae bacterium]|nr:SDR family oxidoreductase [Gemmatimonadaceae bacterium]